MKEIMTLTQWLIQKTNSEAYRAGRLQGWRHPKVDKEMIAAVGGMRKLLKQAAELEKDFLLGGTDRFYVDWRNLNSDIEKIHYDISIIPELCKREGIEDPRETQKKKIKAVQTWRDQMLDEIWILPYYDNILEKLENGKNVSDTEDAKLFQCLNAVAKQKEFVWERVFSAKLEVLNSSKEFRNKYKERIFHILETHSPYYVDGMNIDELYAMHGIHSYSQTLEWKGPLQYTIDNEIYVDSSINKYGTVLNAQTMEHSVPTGMKNCRKIMTIENKANYENMTYREDTLYIFCHGFFSPKEMKFLSGISEIVNVDCEFYHWGDMDFGGINIFHFIKEKLFPKLIPYRMSADDFWKAIEAGAGIQLEDETRQKLVKKDAGVLNGLKDAILEAGRTIEQEMLL